MSDRVPSDQIELIVGIVRHPTDHYGRAVSAAQVFYILHSEECRASTPDLRDCPYSLALDEGIDADEWPADRPVRLRIEESWLAPAEARP